MTPSLYNCGNCNNGTGSRASLTVRILSKVQNTKGAESRLSTGISSQWQKKDEVCKSSKMALQQEEIHCMERTPSTSWV